MEYKVSRTLALTHSLVLEHFQEFLDAFIARLQRLFLRFDPQFQFLFIEKVQERDK